MAGIVELLPKEFGYVILTVIAYCFLNIFMQIQVGRARKRYNVPYPILYATEADSKDYKIFNCIQRGHQNSLETLPIFFTLLVLGGIRHPVTCSVLGVVYTVSRFFYFTGYSSGDPKGRLPLGKYNVVAILGLMFINIWSGMDEDEKYNRKLEFGLYSLQLIAVGLGHLWTSEHPRIRARIELLLKQQKLTKKDVKDVLQEYHDNIGDLEGPDEKEKAQAKIQRFIAAL